MRKQKPRQPQLSPLEIRDRIHKKHGVKVGQSGMRLCRHDLEQIASGKVAWRWKDLNQAGLLQQGEWPPPPGWLQTVDRVEVWVSRDGWSKTFGVCRTGPCEVCGMERREQREAIEVDTDGSWRSPVT